MGTFPRALKTYRWCLGEIPAIKECLYKNFFYCYLFCRVFHFGARDNVCISVSSLVPTDFEIY